MDSRDKFYRPIELKVKQNFKSMKGKKRFDLI